MSAVGDGTIPWPLQEKIARSSLLVNAPFLEKWGHASGLFTSTAADDDVILAQAFRGIEGTVEGLINRLALSVRRGRVGASTG